MDLFYSGERIQCSSLQRHRCEVIHADGVEMATAGCSKGRPARPQRAKRRGGTNLTSCGPFALAAEILANGKSLQCF